MTDPAPEVHATAVPNDLSVERLRVRPAGDGSLRVDPASVGWRYLSFETATLQGDESRVIGAPDHESAIVNVSGGDLVLDLGDGEEAVLAGRTTVFDRPASVFYVPAGGTVEVTAIQRASRTWTTIAIASAPTRAAISADFGPVWVRPEDVRIEIRGAGRSTREIRHLIGPEFPADRLLLVEVITPAGNWSSWPPHKHDVDDMPTEAVLEEVYHYRFRRPEAWGIQRLYRAPGGPLGEARDGVWAVRDGETVIVTDGYHPFVATDADDAYYLNALAGDRRTMACSFDPALDHVRERWASEPLDPRVLPATTRPAS